jgi:hypothetical protein
LYWGERLYLLQLQHRAEGVRGNAKGKTAYLEAEKIPRRLAYRPIGRYQQITRLVYAAHAKNEALQMGVAQPLTLEQMEKICAAIEAMCDGDPVTNGEEVGK